MPWKESSVMEERLRFVAQLLEGESMTDLCRQFGISRKTGYKLFDRYKEHCLSALTDRSAAGALRQPAAAAARRLCGDLGLAPPMKDVAPSRHNYFLVHINKDFDLPDGPGNSPSS